jgi:hypothetical protein
MNRPNFITDEDIDRWSDSIDDDPLLDELKDIPLLREVLYAGLWMAEKLKMLDVSDEEIIQLNYYFGGKAFGHEDCWVLAQEVLEEYKRGEIVLEKEPSIDPSLLN